MSCIIPQNKVGYIAARRIRAVAICTWMAVFCSVLTMAPAIAADEPKQKTQPSYALSTEGSITIDVDGLVREYRLDRGDKIPPEIAANLDRGIKKWRLEPIMVDGRAVNAKTAMKLDMEIDPYQEGYRMKVTNVSFGTPTQKSASLKPPKYPKLAQRAGIQARVVLVLALDVNGEVVRAVPEQVSLSGTGREKIVQEWRQIFEESALVAARRWKFTINETFEGKAPQETLVRIPVDYQLGDEPHWMALYPVKMPSHSSLGAGSIAAKRIEKRRA